MRISNRKSLKSAPEGVRFYSKSSPGKPKSPQCCKGGAQKLVFKYLGAVSKQLIIKTKDGKTILFNGQVDYLDVITIMSAPGTKIDKEIRFYYNGLLFPQLSIHISCSQPLEAGMIFGDFLLLSGVDKYGNILCGNCTHPQCGGGGCVPATSCPVGKNCGTYPDGCGGTINCGTCPSGKVCENNTCKDGCVGPNCPQCPDGSFPDCAGVCNGPNKLDCAGNCYNTQTEIPPKFKDCAGVCGGNATYDCAGVCNGTSELDCAGVCYNPRNGPPPHIIDCQGVCDGEAVPDCKGVCGGSSFTDCAGVCGGNAVYDCKGICNGTSSYDCKRVCGGDSTYDCEGNCYDPNTEQPLKIRDCDGVCGGDHYKDCAGRCIGPECFVVQSNGMYRLKSSMNRKQPVEAKLIKPKPSPKPVPAPVIKKTKFNKKA